MKFLYNISILFYELAIRICSLWSEKAKQWVKGRESIFERMREAVAVGDKIIWVHAASLGEFEQGRPVIEEIRAQYPEYKILLTFFSPSGYEIRKGYEGADYIFYLPIDRPSYVKRFLDIVNPEIAIFIKYEFWLNYLSQLRAQGVRTFIISSIFRQNSIFFKSYGVIFRCALESFESIFVQDEESKRLLATIGFDNVIVAGDTRFDRVWSIVQQAKHNALVETFKAGQDLMIAGSTWEPDEDIIIPLIESNPQIKFVIAPHEIDEARVEALVKRLQGVCSTVRYTECGEGDDLAPYNVLVLDTMGMLSGVYRYARWAYIGGGFGRGIHNTLEAATFALPIAFGVNYHKFKEACDLISLGAATSVDSAQALNSWFASLLEDRAQCDKVSRISHDYMGRQRGATSTIIQTIFVV
ncbi:MAG: glycosyltransferase N-terminal domain-containing protein [Rikenellaceae bacterium]